MHSYLRQAAIAWAILGGVIIFMIVAITTTNVGAFAIDRVARHFGTTFSALPGYEDFVRLAISCAALMFFPYCQYKRGHVFVDLFVSKMPLWAQRSLDALSHLLTMLLAMFLAYWMVIGMLETKADNAVSRILGWPEWPFYFPGAISLALWAMIAATQIFDYKGSTDD